MSVVLKHLFLDLEDTIITPVLDGWWNTELINLQKIRRVIELFQPDYIHLFSFAIHNDFELSGFDRGTRPMIETALETKLTWTPTVDGDIIPACCRTMHLSKERVDFIDLGHFWGKHQAFRLFIYDKFKKPDVNIEVLLLDDMVVNETFAWPDSKVKGTILNIDNLPGEYQ